MSSDVAKAIARYSASALDLATISCFSLFQDIKLPPMNTQYLDVERLFFFFFDQFDVERLYVGEFAQSASL